MSEILTPPSLMSLREEMVTAVAAVLQRHEDGVPLSYDSVTLWIVAKRTQQLGINTSEVMRDAQRIVARSAD